MTAWAALLAHCVLNTNIWLDCCMYCWSIAFCCLDRTLDGRGCEGGMFMDMQEEEEVGGPGARPIPGPRGPEPNPPKSFPKSQCPSSLMSSSLKSSGKGRAPTPQSSFTPSLESKESRKESVSDLMPTV
jgi:hypothetical protein